MKIIGLFFFFIFIIVFPNYSADYYFANVNIDSGLPSNVTSAIVQDNRGFIWIGTEKGLCRYDAYSMVYFNKESQHLRLPSNRISSLLLDGDMLWVGTWEKLCVVNTKTFEITTIDDERIKTIRTLCKDTNGTIWVGCNNGLFRHSKQNQNFQWYNTNNSQLSHNTIRTLHADDQGVLWIGTYNGLNSFDEKRFKPFYLKGNYKPEIANNLILDIDNSSQNDSVLVLGTETGLCFFNKITGQFSSINMENSSLSNEVIKSIHVNGEMYWLGTDFGLNVYNSKTGIITTYLHNPHISHSICNNVVRQIFRDSNGVIWFATFNGVSLLELTGKGYSFNEVIYEDNNLKAGNLIRDILVTDDGTKWMATIHGVIKEDTKGNREFFTSQSPAGRRLLIDNVYSIEKDPKGRIWIGTAAGINIWDTNHYKMHSVTSNTKNGLSSNYIKDIVSIGNKHIGISAWEGGVYIFSDLAFKKDRISFKQLGTDSESFICTLNDKLYYTNHHTLIEYDPISMQSKLIIDNLAMANDGELMSLKSYANNELVMLFRDGIIKYDLKDETINWLPFAEAIEQIMSVEVDAKGHYWIATHHSIMKFNPKAEALLTIPLNTNAPFKSFQGQCSSQSTNGNLLFGGENGYIELNPSFRYEFKNSISTVISGLSVNNISLLPNNASKPINKDIGLCNNLHFKHNQNSFIFRFSNLDFWLPTLNNYKYKLSGYDNEWQHPAQNQNFAMYSNLPAGEYVFEVKGINHRGQTSNNISKLTFTIKPPLWLSKGFLMLYIVIITAIVYLAFYIVNYRNRLTNKLKIIQLEKEHSEQLLLTKQKFFTNISHEFRTPLSLIVPPIKQVLSNGNLDNSTRRMLQMASKNSNRLMLLVNQILDFRKMETSGIKINPIRTNITQLANDVFESFADLASRHEINYHFTAQPDKTIAIIDQEKVRTILFNLLSNAFKHTPVNGTIKVNVNQENQQLAISVSDTGKGIASHEQAKIFERFYQGQSTTEMAGTGIGLTLSLEYANLHKGTILLKSEAGIGSCFTLQLPITEQSSQQASNHQNNDLSIKKEINANKTENTKPVQHLNILVIDDNEDILDFIELNLKHLYNIVCANNGIDGLKMASKVKPSLIISDVMMPGMDGHLLCRKVRENTNLMHIPVILLTAQSLDEQKLKGVKSGADQYITKPFNIDYLITCIDNLIKRDEYLLNYAQKVINLHPAEASNNDLNMDTLFIKRVMATIENNMADSSFSVEVLAKEMGLSSTHLYRKLKSLTGYSSQDIIKNYRLENAAKMLKNNQGNISDIMYQVGFSGLSTFSKAFKAHFGMSPSEYVKAQNKTPHSLP